MSAKNSKKKNAKKITTIFTLAFAVRKFQKFESNSYNRKDFFLKDIHSFVYAIRKFKLNFTDFKFVDNFPNELINLTELIQSY